MLYIKRWRSFAWEQPSVATVMASIPFFALMMLVTRYTSSIYEHEMSAGMGLTITALYLALAVFVGLTTPLRVGSIGPVLAYVAVTTLWPIIPGGDTFDSITYDSGWVGGILYRVLIPSGVIWLFVYVGYAIGSPGDNR